MHDACLTFFYFILFLFLPGFIGISCFRKKIDSFSLLLSFAFSYAFFCLTFYTYLFLEANLTGFKNFITGYYLATLFISSIFLLPKLKKLSLQNCINKELLSGLLIIFLVALHHVITGPYDQIPADVLTHLIRFKETLALYSENSQLQQLSLQSLLTEKPKTWYHLVVVSTLDTGLNQYQILYVTTLFTKVVFALAIYLFGLIIFKDFSSKVIISFMSAVFACLYFGVNIFSYIQYYSFAPAILAFVLYIAGTAVFIKYLNRPINTKSTLQAACTLLIILITLISVHFQEALFLIVTILGIAITAFIINYKNESKRNAQLASLTIFILGLLCFAICYFYISNNFKLNHNSEWKLWDFGAPVSFLPAIKVLNLKYQGLEVLTYWGVFIYCLFFIYYKKFKNNAYLIAGMASPLITALNPVFIDFITRITSVNFVYRLLFITPIYYIAGLSFVLLLKRVINNRNKRASSGILLFVFIFSFFAPLYQSSHKTGFSRIETLKSVAKNEGYDRFEDLIEFLNKQKTKYILTDPVLGYTLNAFTRHTYNSFTFRKNFNKFTFKDYSKYPIASKRSGWFLIINNRNNTLNTKSRSGKLSRHWPENIFEVSSYYPANLIAHINNNPDLFIPVWSSHLNDIKIYQVKKYRH